MGDLVPLPGVVTLVGVVGGGSFLTLATLLGSCTIFCVFFFTNYKLKLLINKNTCNLLFKSKLINLKKNNNKK